MVRSRARDSVRGASAAATAVLVFILFFVGIYPTYFLRLIDSGVDTFLLPFTGA